jgi:pimeloyl-ACP methyl ester carboxylesterase
VLLPGLHGNTGLMAPFAEAAPVAYTARTISFPEHEIQSYPELAGLIRAQLPGSQHIIVAESYSGPAAALVAAEGPPGLLGLVLCNSFITPPVSRLWIHFPLVTLFRIPGPSFIIRRYFVGKKAAPAWVSRLRRVVLDSDPRVLAARTRATFTVDVREPFARVGVPILDLRGTGDRLVSPRLGEVMAATNPRLTHDQIAGPHLLLQIAGEAAWQAIDTFVCNDCLQTTTVAQEPHQWKQ